MPSGFRAAAILDHWRPCVIALTSPSRLSTLIKRGGSDRFQVRIVRDLVLPRLAPVRSRPRSMLRNSCLLDDLAPFGCIGGHPIAHFFRCAAARFQAEPQHPVPDVGRL
jgi:hypothetical protein